MKKLITLLAVTISLILSAGETQAAFVSGFTGNTQFNNNNSTTGFVNFAVYQNTGNWITDLGLSNSDINPILDTFGGDFATITGLEENVFFYQVVAIAGGNVGLTIPSTGLDPWTGGGYLGSDLVFNENMSGAVNTNNPTLGTASSNPSIPSTDGDLSAASAFTPSVGVTGVTAPDGGSFLSGSFSFPGTFLSAETFSPVLFLTSNSAPFTPVFTLANTSSGGSLQLPASNPEPGSLILLSMGMAGVVGYRRRKKKLELPEEEPVQANA